MIPGLHGYAREYELTTPADFTKATIGVAADLLSGLNSAEIVARLGSASGLSSSASGSPRSPGSPGSPAAGSAAGSAAETTKFIVVFDGPARTTASRLDDGLQRRRVMRTLLEAGIPFIVAPALAAAQLAYLHEHHYISHVAGAEEALLWGDVPLVLDLFASSPQVLRRQTLLAHLRLGETAFTEVVLGVGRNAVVDAQLPLLDHAGNAIESAVRNAIQFGGPAPPPPPQATGPPPPSISVYRAAAQACDPAYVATLQRALTFVARQPVLSADGTVLLHNKLAQAVPNDLADVVGTQLSPGAYWFLQRGLLGPELLRALLWGTFADAYRVSATTPELHAALVRVQELASPVRQQAYALLVSQMHRYFQVKEVVNRTEGGANFVRTTPKPPALSPNPTPDSVVADAVQHARLIAELPEGSVSEMPERFARRAVPAPAAVLVRTASLALRELVESVVCWFIATEQVPRSIDTSKIVLALPWA